LPLFAFGLAIVLFSGCLEEQFAKRPVPTEGPFSKVVYITGAGFVPSELYIRQGTQVTWVNDDSTPHTATSEGRFDSGVLRKGDSFSKRFDSVGVYDYVCVLHPLLRGVVNVTR